MNRIIFVLSKVRILDQICQDLVRKVNILSYKITGHPDFKRKIIPENPLILTPKYPRKSPKNGLRYMVATLYKDSYYNH